MEPTDHVEVNTRLTLDLATAGKENRRPHKLKKKKKKLTAQEEEPETPKDARPVDETTPQGFGQLHLDNMRMLNDLYNLTTEQGADRKELVVLKCDYMKQRRLLDIYRQMVQGSMELHTALKKQNDELCERMCELAEANSRLWKLRQQVGAGRPTIPPVARTIERGTLSRPIHKPPETKEELKKALAKANRTNSQFSEQNLDLAKLVTTLKTELTKYRYLEESDYDDDSDGAFGEFDAQFAIPKNASDRPSKLSSIRPSLVAKDADDNKSDKCETRMAKPTPNASIDIFTQVTNDIHDSKPHDGAKPCSDQPDDEVESISEIKRNGERNESFNETKRNDENYKSWSEIKPTHENVCEIKPHDENKSNEKNQDNEELDSVEEDRYHGETEKWNLNNKDDNDDRISNELEAVVEDRDMNKDDNDDYTSEVPGTKAKKRGWDDGDDSDEEDAPSKRVKTENIRPVADFRLEVDGGGFLTSAEFLQLITNGASPNPNLPWT
ncbi:hypothetical protein BG000_008278 [Podila horticola]|nr:hypothetical protein BG000_008278 [Podila horticola]